MNVGFGYKKGVNLIEIIWKEPEVLPLFNMLTIFQLGIGKASFLSRLSQLWLFLVLTTEKEGIAKVFI